MRHKLTDEERAEGWADTDFSFHDAEGEVWRVQFSRWFDPTESNQLRERLEKRAYDEETQRWRMDKLLEIAKEVAPDVSVIRFRIRDQETS